MATGSAPGPAGGAVRTLFRLRSYARAHRVPLVVLLVFGGAEQGFLLIGPLLTQQLIDGPIRHRTADGLLALAALALVASVGAMVSEHVGRLAHAAAGVGIETRLRRDLYGHLQRLPLAFHQQWASGQLLSRATGDLRSVGWFVGFGAVFMLLQASTYLAVSVLMLRLYWPLGLAVMAGVVPIALISRAMGRHYIRLSRRMQDELGDLSSLIEESVLGFRTVRAFGRHQHLNALFARAAGKVRGTGQEQLMLIAFQWPLLEIIPGVMLGIVLIGGGYAVAHGALSVGGLVAFATLLYIAIGPLDALGWMLAQSQQSATAAQRIYEVLDTPPTIVDRPDAVALRPADVTGRLAFERVTFTYPGTTRPVLRDVDLVVRPGETMALVGASGSGKTTLTLLAGRLYDVTGGRITLDGHDLRDLRLNSVREIVCQAFEDPTLFSASVRENVALGRPDATDDEVRDALRVAQARFVDDLPWGLDTRIGEQGLSLSGGQRQRLALARAVLARPRLLVLDDPLSALDVETEALVEDALRTVLVGATALLVVHRPSTIALADRVALVADGTIAAVGTHEELMATLPAYRDVLSAEPIEVPR